MHQSWTYSPGGNIGKLSFECVKNGTQGIGKLPIEVSKVSYVIHRTLAPGGGVLEFACTRKIKEKTPAGALLPARPLNTVESEMTEEDSDNRTKLRELLEGSQRALENARRDRVDAATLRTFEEVVERYKRLLGE